MTRSTPARPPVIWSIAGTDSAGGAGLSADQRAADAFGVHLCPVVAAVTAQHSQGVQAVFPLDAQQLDAQLHALAQDLPPRAIKTGLLASVAAVQTVARWVDHLRAQAPAGVDPHQHLALVIDPVLRASAGGAPLSDPAIVQAYRHWLLPRASVITPNRAEAWALLDQQPPPNNATDANNTNDTASAQRDALPDLAAALQALGPHSVLITGGDALDTTLERRWSLDWLQSPPAQGWLCAPRVDTAHHHGTGCTLAAAIAAALAIGHGQADACVLARMVVHHALMNARAAGAGRGPVIATSGALAGPAHGGAPLPWLSLGRELPWRLLADASPAGGKSSALAHFLPFAPPPDRLYGICPDGPSLAAALQAGLSCVQLRHKPTEGAPAALAASVQAAAQHGATLFVNDHWRLALSAPRPTDASGAPLPLGIHLGQEDLLALSANERAALRQRRHDTWLGLSSHCPWELARALGCGPSYVACGPVQATTTKDMPWLPQGEGNLRWWRAQSDVPVVAIGGLLHAHDLRRFATCNPAALCIVRALHTPAAELPARIAELRIAARAPAIGPANSAPAPPPHPCLPHPTP